MIDFAILSWSPQDESVTAPLIAARHALGQLGWTRTNPQPGLEVWVADLATSVVVSPAENGLVVGQVIGDPGRSWAADPTACARSLSRTTWGRYVAVLRRSRGPAVALYREPSGGLDGLAWRQDGLVIVASDVGALLEAVPPKDLAIDWQRLGMALRDPAALAGHCPLTGVLTATPGALRDLETGAEAMIWRPVAWARQGLADTAETRGQLRDAVDKAVEGQAGSGARVIAELSGGLDSSIVGSALQGSPNVEVVEWLHYFVEDSAGDERPYARAAARHLGVRLTEAPKASFGLNLDAMAKAASAMRPSRAVIDSHYDVDMARRCQVLGATHIFTGMGGDTIFMQGKNRLLAADAYWGRPFWQAGIEPALSVARHARRSVWSVWRHAQAARFSKGPTPHVSETGHLSERVRQGEPPQHAWLTDLEGVPPAKRRQIGHLAHQLLVGGRSQRGQLVHVINPLLSQPVMEMCLSLSAMAQTNGGDDRAMARQAFQDRLAPEIFARRSKGDLGRHYGRAIAEELPQLRAHLLEGVLAQAGILDTDALDAVLTEERLIWQGPYREIVEMILLEQWARLWSARLARIGRRVLGERPVEPA